MNDIVPGVSMKFSPASSLAAIGACAILAAPVQAEVLPVSGIYAAGSDAASAVETIAVENFGGDEGAALSFAITDRLENVRIEGETYFQIFPTSGDDVDAVLRGSANAEVLETELEDRKVTKCTKKDKDKKCIREKVTFYECTELSVTLYPRVRLIAQNGGELYSARDSLSRSASFCANDSSIPSAQGMIDSLISQFAGEVRSDFAPVERFQEFRVLESRKGMDRDAKKAFKTAVKLTKSDVAASCNAFAALEDTNPQHVSVLFNIGLCAEGQGDLDAAENFYQRALDVEPGKDNPTSGISRISSKRRAAEQLAVRFGAENSQEPVEDQELQGDAVTEPQT